MKSLSDWVVLFAFVAAGCGSSSGGPPIDGGDAGSTPQDAMNVGDVSDAARADASDATRADASDEARADASDAPSSDASDATASDASRGFEITTALAIDPLSVDLGTTVHGVVTYTNMGSAAVAVQSIIITTRPPGGTHGGGPYDDMAPTLANQTVAPGMSLTLSASRLLSNTDPSGMWEAYATWEDAAGAWHDGPSVFFTVNAPTGSSDPAKALHGIYPGYADATGMAYLANWETNVLQHRVGFIDANLDPRDWSNAHANIWAFYDPSNVNALRSRHDIAPALTAMLTSAADVTTYGTRAALQRTASGANDATYQYLCQLATAAGVGTSGQYIIARIGHEADCCYPWRYEGGNADVYIAAFRHIATLLRTCFNTTGTGVLIDYNGTVNWTADYHDASGADTGMSRMTAAYPGDAYVDIIGVDIYSSSSQPWTTQRSQLDQAEAFAVTHGKMFSIPEWGLRDAANGGVGDDPTFIQSIHDWLDTLPATGPGRLAYNNYFQGWTPADLDSYPLSRARYISLFGGP